MSGFNVKNSIVGEPTSVEVKEKKRLQENIERDGKNVFVCCFPLMLMLHKNLLQEIASNSEDLDWLAL